MTRANTPHDQHFTLQQFIVWYQPTLITQLRIDLKLAFGEARSLSEKVVARLKAKFQGNTLQSAQVFKRTITIIADQETKKYRRILAYQKQPSMKW